MALDANDLRNNYNKLFDILFTEKRHIIDVDNAKDAALMQKIIAFTDRENITLINLTKVEAQYLANTYMSFYDNQNFSQAASLQAALAKWKNNGLKHAINGQGEHVRLHASQVSTITNDIQTKGQVPPDKWGTDLDIRFCLKNEIVDPKNINRAGRYILNPVSITESSVALQDKLKETVNKAKSSNIKGNIKLLIPVNSNNSHWRLLTVDIKDKHITKVNLWDSMRTHGLTKQSAPVNNIREAVKGADAEAKVDQISVKAAGKQHDGFRCMDYTIQQALRVKGVNDSPIVQAKTGAALRQAVFAQIKVNFASPATPVQQQRADAARENNTTTTPKHNNVSCLDVDTEPKLEDYSHVNGNSVVNAAEVQQQSIEEKAENMPRAAAEIVINEQDVDNIHNILIKHQQTQFKFDEIYATELNNAYKKYGRDAEKFADEASIDREAYAAAIKNYGLFHNNEQAKGANRSGKDVQADDAELMQVFKTMTNASSS